MSYKVIIDIIANGAKAVAEFDKAGKAAERMAKKTTDEVEKTRISTEKLGRQAGILGVAMLGAAGSVAFVMRGWVKHAQEAEEAQMRLESSVRGSYGTASRATQAFEAQAKALQKVTVASDEDIISFQALLVQFGLTQRQVTTLTPLVVDISRKWGIDYMSAAKAAAKAADGKVTALKKLGINVDAAKAKTDPYIATVEALRKAAGGFAEEEGKTFAGQTAILANQMNDLKENLGRGVLDVLNRTIPVVNKVAGAFSSLDDATGGAIGSVAAVGTGFLAVAGAAGVALKTMLSLKEAFQQAADAEGLAGELTQLAGDVAVTSSAVALGASLGASIANAVNDRIFHLSENADKGYRKALSAKRGRDIMVGFVTAAGAEAARANNILASIGNTWAATMSTILKGKPQNLLRDANFFTIAGEAGFDKAFTKVAASSQEAAQKILDFAEANPKWAASMKGLGFELEKYKARMADVNDVNKDGKRNMQDLELSTKQTADAVSTLQQALSNGGAVSRGFAQSQVDLARAQQGVTDAQKAYTEAVRSGDRTKVKEATLDLRTAMLNLASAQDQAREAAFKHGQMLLALQAKANNKEAFQQLLSELKTMKELLTDPAEKKAIEDEIDTLVLLANQAKTPLPLNDADLLTSLARLRESGKLTEDGLVAIQVRAGAKLDLNDSSIMASLWRLKAAGEITDKQLKDLGLPKTVGPLDTKDVTAQIEALTNKFGGLRDMFASINGSGTGPLGASNQQMLQYVMLKVAHPDWSSNKIWNWIAEHRAAGGPVSANTPYMVGEQGPELFVPSSSGTIIPNGALNGGTSIGGLGTVININVASSALSTPAETGAAVVDALTAWQRRNGRLPLQVA